MCLSTFVPQADDDGLDLLVLDKLTRQTFGIQIKPRFASEVSPPGTVRFDMRLKTFHEASNEFLLVPIIDPAAGEPLRFWPMPFSDLRSIASEKRGHRIISPSPSIRSADGQHARTAQRDRFAPWCRKQRCNRVNRGEESPCRCDDGDA